MKVLPYTIENGIRTDCSTEIAKKIVSLLAKEKCTVRESHNILRLAASVVNDLAVTVLEDKPVERVRGAKVVRRDGNLEVVKSNLFEQTRQQALERHQSSELSHS